MKWLKKIINRLFKTRLTTVQFRFLRNIYRERNCAHCCFLVEYANWWCSNNDSRVPCVCHCPYWKPDKKFIKRQLREFEKTF